ncbi:type IV pili twitching motility protein PilT [Candidatus Kuenenbacteria bacterium CG10_big_fil_rev_8_21_14_0_10_36_11]|uniref:Type IV pili twitching motility protein PilT n=1 Tax=Candidatus Kuenenbacteria bacterium CG10_big_fil_rev_8_21_14_0_10_36_11 TaxID=1974618 RepID=A0A2M6WB32_9BACT|nr:MAG: type IV pili twitching motility protein PilT [Candidatus Kuenenbacteria bacterium CG10_big_fil_rev_8_21_14_0_10_36_11]
MNLKEIFQDAVIKGASDVHIIVGKPPIFRIIGDLKVVKNAPEITSQLAEDLIFALLTAQQKERLEQERELDFSEEISDKTRFRINCHYEKNNLGLVARIIPAQIPTPEELGLPAVVCELTRKNQGLILLTGPTGCGKSTTLAAMINLINQERSATIVTLEDPIEFLFQPTKSIIMQRQLGTDVLSFEQGLKHVVRQDPNVIMVGEMRDLETIAATLTLAETGHLVLATLHTNNASQAVDRIIDVFPPYQQDQIRLQLSMVLSAIIAQQLLLKKGGGRMAVREILINNSAVANLICERKTAQIKNIIQTSLDEGMISMDQALQNLVKQDLVSSEVANTYMIDGKI